MYMFVYDVGFFYQKSLMHVVNIEIKRCGIIDNKTLHKRSNKVEISNYKSQHGF